MLATLPWQTTSWATGVLPTRAHLAIDATIGARLMAAGLTLRNEPDPALVLLVSMGPTKLLLTSLLERGRITGAPAPHDRAPSVSTAS
jgi:hypothetical protein